jgi:hypothetical protein
LGITTSWIWPWGQTTPPKTEFDSFYASVGHVPASSGPIAVFGLSVQAMTHGSISGPGHGPRWESKCGAWLRMQHGLAEMEGGTIYGNVLGFYEPSAAPSHIRKKAMPVKNLSKSELKLLTTRIQAVDPNLRDRFESAYQAWRDACNHPLIVVSSSPLSRTHTPEFLALVAMGPDILPLLMGKLTEPDEFFALQAVDRLLRPEFVITRQPADPSILLGEQGRALDTVRQWIVREA